MTVLAVPVRLVSRAEAWLGDLQHVPTKVFAKLEGLLDGQIRKILLSKGDHLALRHEPSKLVLAGVGQGAKLDAPYLSANGGSEVSYSRALWEEVLVGGVGILAVLVMLKRLQRGILLFWIPDREVMRILHRIIKSTSGSMKPPYISIYNVRKA